MTSESKKSIVAAGRVIADRMEWTTANEELLIPAFRVAHDWRLAHTTPMRVVRHELSIKARRLHGFAVTAGRLKRMQSIRRKLQRTPLTLYQIQDIAGCRAIVETMQGVQRLADHLRSDECRHGVQREDDYVLAPKHGGYRGVHIILKFDGVGDQAAFNRQTVEVQLRTRLQHAWATAVEAVGLVRNEDLKAGRGDPRWLRLFALMAGVIAEDEGGAAVPDLPAIHADRLKELGDLERDLDAIQTMEGYNNALKSIEGVSGVQGMSFLIRYDNARKTVSVLQRSKFSRLAEEYFAADVGGSDTAVLVEVDRVSDLKSAYPNYFLDVVLFVEKLKVALGSNEIPVKSAVRGIDLSWWFRDA